MDVGDRVDSERWVFTGKSGALNYCRRCDVEASAVLNVDGRALGDAEPLPIFPNRKCRFDNLSVLRTSCIAIGNHLKDIPTTASNLLF